MTPPDALATRPTDSLSPATTLARLERTASGRSSERREAGRNTCRSSRVSLKERMTYRGDFLLGTILRFLPMVTTILLWQAIYAGSGQICAGQCATSSSATAK